MYRFFLCFFFCWMSYAAAAQGECEKNLQRARSDFAAGKLPEVARRLSDCAFAPDGKRPQRREILSLLLETYLYLDQNQEAERAYEELIALDPFFQPNDQAPEVDYLMDSYETFPLTWFSLSGGIYGWSRPLTDERFSPQGVSLIRETFKRNRGDLYGWFFGASGAVNLFDSNLDLSVGLALSSLYFRYAADLDNALAPTGDRLPAVISFQEKHRWIQIPVSLNWTLIPKEKIIHSIFIPYLYAGIAPEFMLRETAQFVGPSIRFAEPIGETSDRSIDIQDLRNKSNVSLVAGAGMKFHFKRYFFLVDLRYHRLLRNLADTQNRQANPILLQTYNYLDNDFRLHQLGFSGGVGFFLFKSKKKSTPNLRIGPGGLAF